MVKLLRLDIINAKIERHQTFIRDALKAGHADEDCRAAAKSDMALPHLRLARTRIEEGVGTMCLDCGTEIPPKRLEAVPGAVRCVNCQSELERRYGQLVRRAL